MRWAALLAVAVVVAGCSDAPDRRDAPARPSGSAPDTGEAPAPALRLVDAARDLGLDWRHDPAVSPEKHLPETMAGGGGFVDVDGDGRLDVVLVQSANFPGRDGGSGAGNALFRQREDGTFEDASAGSGLDDAGYGMGVAAADADGDGDPDVLFTNYGPNAFRVNRGDGTFEDRTAAAGLGDERWSTSAAWFDGDRDGDLDLYVVHYVRYDPAALPDCWVPGTRTRSTCSPKLFGGVDDVLYENRGDGTFADVSAAAGVLGFAGKGLGVTVLDLGEDGDDDLIVANDTTPTLLFENAGGLRFEEAGLRYGIAYSEDGVARAGMGIDRADADGDGRTDVFVTNFTAEVNALYTQRPDGTFSEWSRPAGLGTPSYPYLGFGALFSDLDLDGDPDVLVANGHVLDTAALSNRATTYEQHPLLFRNDGAGRFEDVSATSGPVFSGRYVGRALAAGDVDRDGDEDFLMVQVGGPALLLRNESERAGHVVVLHLVGTASNTDAIGARVTVSAGARTRTAEVASTRSYLATHDRRLRFATGERPFADRVEILWPSGAREVLDDVRAGAVVTIEEGKGIVGTAPFE